jgi:AraC-like DNA-binding protein
MDALDELRDLIERHCPDGDGSTAIPRVSLLRSEVPTTPIQGIFEPVFCIVAQGRKQAVLGDALFDYDAGKYVVVSVDLPVSSTICEASASKPYLAFALTLVPELLAALLLDLPATDAGTNAPAGLAVSALTTELLSPVVRLLRLLDRPRDIPMLAPLAEREILYYLLLGDQGATLRQIALADSRLSQISRAIEWLRRNYAQPLRIEFLARIANMSPSTFHRHFKVVTAMSPLQFQKRIRLQEARYRLLAQESDVTRIGLSVGYESPSQFSREYSRLFGAPPGRDAARLRSSAREAPQLARSF